jgi:hypothetical protein
MLQKRMAPQVGLEPTTLRLTAGCSAIELLRSVVCACQDGETRFSCFDFITQKLPATSFQLPRAKSILACFVLNG